MIGQSLLDLLSGVQDPKAQLLQAAVGQGTPQAGTPSGGDGTTVPAAPATGTDPAARMPGGSGATPLSTSDSPPDLAAMYEKIIGEQRRQNTIAGVQRGVNMIAAGFAQESNRPGLLAAARGTGSGGVDGTGSSGVGTIKSLMELQNAMNAQKMKAQLRTKLPAISKQYGIPMETVEVLFENGQLEETLKQLAVPDNQIVQYSDGRSAVISRRDGKEVSVLGPPEQRKYDVHDTGNGGVIAVDPYNPQAGKIDINPQTPETVVVKNPDGSQYLANKVTGEKVKDLSPAEVKKYDIQNQGRGGVLAVNPLDPTDKVQVTPQEALPKKTEVIKTGTGKQFLIDSETGTTIKELTPDEAKKYQIENVGQGGVIAVDPLNPTAPLNVRNQDANKTSDTVELDRANIERAQRGLPAMTMEDWLKQREKGRSEKLTTIVDSGDKALVEGFGKSLVEDFQTARAGRDTIDTIGNAGATLRRGIVAGSILSPAAQESRKVIAQVLGIPDADAQNSDVFLSSMKEIVLPKVKALGTGNSISNADREFIEKATAGTLQLDERSIQTVLNMTEKIERARIKRYNESISKFKNDEKVGKYVRDVQMPAPSPGLIGAVTKQALDRLRSNPTPQEMKLFNDWFGTGMAEYFVGESQ